MVPLDRNYRICLFIGLFTESDDLRSKSKAFLSNFVITSNISFLAIVSIAYCFQNFSDVEQATHAFYVIAAALLGLAWNLVVLLQRKTFKNLLLELRKIVTDRIDKKTSFDYNPVERKVKAFTKNYIILFLVADVASMVMMPALVAGFYYYKGSFQLNSWYLPLVTTTPYDQNSTIGRIISHITQTSGITGIVEFLCPVTTCYFAVCNYIDALFIDLAQQHSRIDDHFTEESPREVNVLEIKEQLVELVLSHSEVHEFMNKFRKLVNGIVFSLFLIGITWLCSGLFQLKFSLDIIFLQNISNLSLIASCMYTYCSNGTIVTYGSGHFASAVYNSLWYKYPLNLQPFIIMIMSRAQKPFYFSGYEFGKCSMENFTKIMNTAFSILMVLRAVDRRTNV